MRLRQPQPEPEPPVHPHQTGLCASRGSSGGRLSTTTPSESMASLFVDIWQDEEETRMSRSEPSACRPAPICQPEGCKGKLEVTQKISRKRELNLAQVAMECKGDEKLSSVSDTFNRNVAKTWKYLRYYFKLLAKSSTVTPCLHFLNSGKLAVQRHITHLMSCPLIP